MSQRQGDEQDRRRDHHRQGGGHYGPIDGRGEYRRANQRPQKVQRPQAQDADPHEVAQRPAGSEPVLVGVRDHEPGHHEEQIDRQIAVRDHPIQGRHMQGENRERGDAPQAVQSDKPRPSFRDRGLSKPLLGSDPNARLKLFSRTASRHRHAASADRGRLPPPSRSATSATSRCTYLGRADREPRSHR